MQAPRTQLGSTGTRTAGGTARLYPFLLLALVLAGVVCIRLRLLSAPLERDEGEYAYGGQLLMQGLPLYKNLYTMKWPGTHAAYALIMAVFGQSAAGIHAGLLLANLISSILVFVLGRRLGGDWMGVGAAATQALLSTNPMLLGLAGHATHFVVLFALGGLCVLQGAETKFSRARIFCAGVLFGLAGLMKQSGLVFAGFAAGWIAWKAWTAQPRQVAALPAQLGMLLLGAMLPIGLVILASCATGGFTAFWLWTVKYARAYVAERTFRDGLGDLLSIARWGFLSAPGFWILAFAGAVLCFVQARWRSIRLFLMALLLCSIAGVCPGWFFRQHYFLVLIPAVSLFAGVAVRTFYGVAERAWRPQLASGAVCFGLAGIAGWTCFECRTLYFKAKPEDIWRSEFTPNLFAEAQPVGDFLRAHSLPNQRIAVLGSEPELMFYSHRLSATGHIYMYPLMEPQPYAAAMQQDMIAELETNAPACVVLVQDTYSWLRQTNSPTLLFEWLDRYGGSHLRLVAWVAKLRSGGTEYHWSAPEGPVSTDSACWLAIYANVPDAEGPQQTPVARKAQAH